MPSSTGEDGKYSVHALPSVIQILRTDGRVDYTAYRRTTLFQRVSNDLGIDRAMGEVHVIGPISTPSSLQTRLMVSQ